MVAIEEDDSLENGVSGLVPFSVGSVTLQPMCISDVIRTSRGSIYLIFGHGPWSQLLPKGLVDLGFSCGLDAFDENRGNAGSSKSSHEVLVGLGFAGDHDLELVP